MRIGMTVSAASGTEAGRREADRQSAPIGKPFHRIADAGRVDAAGPDARERGRDIEERERVRDRVERPSRAPRGGRRSRPSNAGRARPVDRR